MKWTGNVVQQVAGYLPNPGKALGSVSSTSIAGRTQMLTEMMNLQKTLPQLGYLHIKLICNILNWNFLLACHGIFMNGQAEKKIRNNKCKRKTDVQMFLFWRLRTPVDHNCTREKLEKSDYKWLTQPSGSFPFLKAGLPYGGQSAKMIP